MIEPERQLGGSAAPSRLGPGSVNGVDGQSVITKGYAPWRVKGPRLCAAIMRPHQPLTRPPPSLALAKSGLQGNPLREVEHQKGCLTNGKEIGVRLCGRAIC